jgi:hypothetical protein
MSFVNTPPRLGKSANAAESFKLTKFFFGYDVHV